MTTFNAIKKWFSGKGLRDLETIIPGLEQSEADGEWQPKLGRRARSVLSKANIAQKTAKAAYKLHKTLWDEKTYGDQTKAVRDALFDINMGMEYGGRYVTRVAEGARVLRGANVLPEICAQAEAFAVDLVPVWALVERLDAARPKPTFVYAEISPTIAKTLHGVNLTLRPETRRLPKFEYIRDEDGVLVYILIIWPEGTVHGKSRFAAGSARNHQCHACGHAIKNAYNWVPLIFDDANGVPHSLWVGRDCSKTLFGVDVKGDLVYKNATHI